MAELSDKIKKLREIHLDSHVSAKNQIDNWEAETARLLQDQDYAKHRTTVRIVEELRKRVAQIKLVLQNDRKLTTEERNVLFERLDGYTWYLKMFDPQNIANQLDSIEKAIDFELNP